MYPIIFIPLNTSPYLSIIRWVKGSDVKAKIVDTDQTAPEGAVRSGFILLAGQSDRDLHCLLRPICMNN